MFKYKMREKNIKNNKLEEMEGQVGVGILNVYQNLYFDII